MSKREVIKELSSASRHLECLQACQDALKINPDESFAYKYAGKSLLALGSLDHAKKFLFKAHQLDSRDPETLKDIGNIFYACHEPKEAARYYNQALKIKPDFSLAINNLGLIARQDGNLQLAKQLVEKALVLDPNFAPFHINLSTIQRDLGNLDQAFISTLKSLEINPKSPDALLNLGTLQRDFGNLDQALVSTLKSLKLNTQNPDALSNLISIQRDLGNLDEALVSTLKLLEINPDNPDTLLILGSIYIDLGQLDKALETSKIALNKGSKIEDSSFVLAARYHEMGLNEEGVKVLSEIQSKEGKCLLLCLYLSLDKKDEFNQCAKYLIDRGWYNQRSIAAIDHANIIYEQSLSNGLNGNTFESIINQNISKDEFPDTLLNEILSYLSKTSVQPKYQTLLINGVQTSGSILDAPMQSLTKLKKLIIKKIEEYNQVCNINTDKNFKSNWDNRKYTLNSWAIIMEKGGNLKSHNHENGWLTGTFYLQMPDIKDGSEEGGIEFSHQGPKYPTKGASFNRKVIRPEARDLNIFSSSLFHRTLPFHSNTQRICIAFDLGRVEKL